MNINPKPVLEVQDVSIRYAIHAGLLGRTIGAINAADNVSLYLNEGETLGLVGESGCGKSSLGRAVVMLEQVNSGTIRWDGEDVTSLSKAALRPLRRKVQMVFQDPKSSLNPKLPVGTSIVEPLLNYRDLSRIERDEFIEDALERVGLPRWSGKKLPHEFSGGQRQRIGMARALSVDPKVIVADEAVSALDVSVQAQIINLMLKLQEQSGLSYLFISHDLDVIEYACDRVAVMYLGRVVETAKRADLFKTPLHPYTQGLLQSAPIKTPKQRHDRQILQGEVPSPFTPPTGCHFHPRCRFSGPRCQNEAPKLRDANGDHQVACHLLDGGVN